MILRPMFALCLCLTACPKPDDCDPSCDEPLVCVDNECRRTCDVASDCDGGWFCSRGLCAQSGCGNGEVEGSEVCDSGALNSDDSACTRACLVAVCGDGLVHKNVEECDTGPANADTAACTGACRHGVCGDGLLWAGEEACDDNNTADGDGCDSDCSVSLNDSCVLAEHVVITSGAAASATGNLDDAVNDANASCGGTAQGNDVFYKLSLAAPAMVQWSVDEDDVTLYVLDYPGGACTGTALEVDCSTTGSLTSMTLGAGAHWLVADAATPKAFNLDVNVLPIADNCDAAYQLPVPARGAFDFTSDTSVAGDDYPDCIVSEGPDLVYSFELNVTSSVRVDLRPDDASEYWSVSYLWDACPGGAAVSCEWGSYVSGGPYAQFVGSLAAGRYYFVIDGAFSDDAGRVEATMTIADPAADTSALGCAAGEPSDMTQPLTEKGSARQIGLLTGPGADDFNASCYTPCTGADAIYRFNPTEAHDVAIKFVPEQDARLCFAVFADPCGAGRALVTANEGAQSYKAGDMTYALSAGSYAFVVRACDATGGAYAFDLELTD